MNTESSIQFTCPEGRAIQTFKALHLLKDTTAPTALTTSILLEPSESGLKLWSTDRYRMLEIYWAADIYSWEGSTPDDNKLSLPLELITPLIKHYTASQLTRATQQERELTITWNLAVSSVECWLSDGTRYIAPYTPIHILDWKAPTYEEGAVDNNRRINPAYLGDLKAMDKIWNGSERVPGAQISFGRSTSEPIRFTLKNDALGEALYYVMEIRAL